jgi:hypothetical protein
MMKYHSARYQASNKSNALLNQIGADFSLQRLQNGESVMSTTSAVAIAASEPSAPMAIPTSALAMTGASLIPSLTKAQSSP